MYDWRAVFLGHTVYSIARVRARVSPRICTRTSGMAAGASVACRRAAARTALFLLPVPPSASLVPYVSVAHSSPVFMRVSMGKGSATRTRRKIISDLPRARRSCRPPYIARRSVLYAAFSKWKPTPSSPQYSPPHNPLSR